MKFIVPVYMGDDCTWSTTEYVAFECNSKEELYVSLVDVIIKSIDTDLVYTIVTVCGSKIDVRWFTYIDDNEKLTYNEPNIMTLDEWFTHQTKLDWC
jgi:hypothetical protein